MQGRFHFMKAIHGGDFPVRVMKYLELTEADRFNAWEACNPNYKVGDIVIIDHHINFAPEHPLHGENDERFGPRLSVHLILEMK
jgi:purine-nucleoside phosphorylase